MRRGSFLAGLLTVVACRGAAGSYDRLSVEAFERGMTVVPEGERTPTSWGCGQYAVLNDQLTSGTERITVWSPCWDPDGGDLAVEPQGIPDVAAEAASDLEAHAERDPRAERGSSWQRSGSVAAACKGLAQRDIERSPFSRRRAIIEIVPHREGTEIRGARIVFKAVPGLSADWMRRAIACHQAQYANFARVDPLLPGDPSLVTGTTVTVSQHDAVIEVLVAADSAHGGRVALARAQELAGPRTATR